MKKIISIIAVLAVAVGLTACKNTADNKIEVTEATESISETAVEETTIAETTTAKTIASRSAAPVLNTIIPLPIMNNIIFLHILYAV